MQACGALLRCRIYLYCESREAEDGAAYGPKTGHRRGKAESLSDVSVYHSEQHGAVLQHATVQPQQGIFVEKPTNCVFQAPV